MLSERHRLALTPPVRWKTEKLSNQLPASIFRPSHFVAGCFTKEPDKASERSFKVRLGFEAASQSMTGPISILGGKKEQSSRHGFGLRPNVEATKTKARFS